VSDSGRRDEAVIDKASIPLEGAALMTRFASKLLEQSRTSSVSQLEQPPAL
jgi:hypothetical protein